jgi:hypothetical protein
MKLIASHRSKSVLFTAAAALAALPLTGFAGTALSAGKESKPVVEPAPESHVHFLFKVEFGSAYITPRGMIVRNKGLTIQPLFLTFVDLYKGDGFLSSVKLVGGVWNDFGTSGVSRQPPYGSEPKTNWTEIDPIAGLSFGLGKHVTLDVTYTAFAEQILDIGTSQHLEVKLSYDDSELLGAFSLKPYILFWQELDGKATAADVPQAVFGPSPKSGNNPQPGSSFYFELGITPSYTFKSFGNLKVELPCRVLLPDQRFYGEYYGSASTVGLVELGFKASAPLTFMPKGYGSWGAYAGVKYQYYNDKNLYNLNTFNAPGEPTRDSWAFYGGLSVFF